jgi:hypothetical protein
METTGKRTLSKQESARLREENESRKSLQEIMSDPDIEKEIAELLSLNGTYFYIFQ